MHREASTRTELEEYANAWSQRDLRVHAPDDRGGSERAPGLRVRAWLRWPACAGPRALHPNHVGDGVQRLYASN